ncbi:hypothetical protein Poli38472_008418 [Pythium oligandrum]|uniref:Erythroid differentiation-related factor 1 n=1 Tax=Pythium oligandrum TaxID=41045 RepID=A0A8K1FK86_PYTOL|nr:hypothetical protein Poli38472_008418 [Pythium oligandrum]|eukprot:TMW65776.1 hypothetical protein Poli38472_008418 [Pythium oligandrum]
MMAGGEDALCSYALPPSPSRSRTGSDNMSVWVEESDGEQHVRVGLSEELGRRGSLALSAPPSPSSSDGILTTAIDSSESMDFPLVLCGDRRSSESLTHAHTTSAAIVPFQKLQVDTNLHQTALPYRSHGAPGSGNSSPRDRAVQFSSAFLGKPEDSASAMTHEFMHAMRLGDLRPQEPQLSVRLRGSRVELASASEEESIDFLGPAENIKKLFKLPYSQDRVSLAVHRVGGTLVVDGELDDADIPAGFEEGQEEAKKIDQQNDQQTQQLLYEKFIYESAMAGRLTSTEEANVREAAPEVQQPPMAHGKGKKGKRGKKSAAARTSIGSSSDQLPDLTPLNNHQTTSNCQANHAKDDSSSKGAGADSSADHGAPSATSFNLPTFQRVLKWKFHDLKMILGSEVLLFSNPEHPAVSLRLHDMEKELSLCTVLDYYLDNVIANIPELAICMHSKGFVRGYKLVETRQIPYMSGTDKPLFDIQEVSMNASMLLKFLKENCSRPNGTYWLYRKEGESSLRLYDVNVLSQGKQLKWKYMMAMLCYRFASRASRMMYSLTNEMPGLQSQLRQRQRDLLRTCITLLGEIAQNGGSSHSSICSSVSEQLADSYLRECEQPDNVSATSDVKAELSKIIEFLKHAKTHLQESIRSFEDCMKDDDASALPNEGEEDLELADLGDENGDTMDSFLREELTRLQLKFSSICLQLARVHSSNEDWEVAMNDVREAIQFLPTSAAALPSLFSDDMEACSTIDELLSSIDFDGVGKHSLNANSGPRVCSTHAELRSYVLELIGDLSSKHPASVVGPLLELYQTVSGEACKVQLPDSPHGHLISLLHLAFSSYLRALFPAVDSEVYFRLMKKLGNSCNELGKYFLSYEPNYQKAFQWFERGCGVFKDIEDGINVALLYANLAHLHKILAQGKSIQVQEKHYEAAAQLCKDAAQLFKQNRAEEELQKKVTGELALTYLVWAVALTNRVPERDEGKRVENEALKMFSKALALYTDLEDGKQVAATHYQMASFQSRLISREVRHQPSSSDPSAVTALKKRMEIARRHYEKALDFFGKVELGKTFVLIHQELSDLYAMGGRFEDIEHALLVLLSTYDAFSEDRVAAHAQAERELLAKLAVEVVEKIKLVLHQLIRLSSASGGTSKARGNETHRGKKPEVYKQMYKEVIYYGPDSKISDVLTTLRTMYLL